MVEPAGKLVPLATGGALAPDEPSGACWPHAARARPPASSTAASLRNGMMVLLVREDLPEEVLLAVRTGWVKESGVVSSTISPPAINTTRWAARRAKPISWGTTSLVVIPSSAVVVITWRTPSGVLSPGGVDGVRSHAGRCTSRWTRVDVSGSEDALNRSAATSGDVVPPGIASRCSANTTDRANVRDIWSAGEHPRYRIRTTPWRRPGGRWAHDEPHGLLPDRRRGRRAG
jgi:hypothetical protein